jgi:methyl-accepting chemotaxis protein
MGYTESYFELFKRFEESRGLEGSFALLNEPAIPWSVALLIVVIAVLLAVTFKIRLRQIKADLKSATRLLNNTPKDTEEFPNHFEKIDETYKDNGTLKHSWSEFTECIIIPESGGALHNTRYPNDYFNKEYLVNPKVNLRFYQSIPNLLIGAGLLFTFIGLVAAIYFASRGLGAGTIEEAQESLTNLLHAATFKFVTSIAGLLSSLIFNWYEKSQLHKLQILIDTFCSELDERFQYITTEQLEHKSLVALQTQTEQLERFNTSLAVSIAQALEKPIQNALKDELSPLINSANELNKNILQSNKTSAFMSQKLFNESAAQTEKLDQLNSEQAETIAQALDDKLVPSMNRMIEPMLNSINQLGTNLGGMNQNALHDMVGKFIEELRGNTQGEMAELKSTLSQLATSLDQSSTNLNSQLTHAIDQLGLKVNAIENSMENGANNFSKQLGLAGEAVSQKFQGSFTELTDASTRLERSMDKFESNIHGWEPLFELTKNSVESLGQTASSITNANQSIINTTSNLERASSTIEQSQLTLSSGLEKISETIKSLNETSQQTTAAWGSYQSRFESVDEQTAELFNQVNTGLQAFSHQVQEFVTELDKQTANSISTLSAGIQEFGESIEELSETLQKNR